MHPRDYNSCYHRPVAINIMHRRDLDDRVERLAARLALRGRGRKVTVIERALSALEERVARNKPDQAAIRASLQQYASQGPHLRERVASPVPGDGRPLSQVLQDTLYDGRGLPR